MTKSTDCRPLRKPARQGGKPAKKGVYTAVNDRILLAKPTQQAKIPADLHSSAGIFAFAGFVSGLAPGAIAGVRVVCRVDVNRPVS